MLLCLTLWLGTEARAQGLALRDVAVGVETEVGAWPEPARGFRGAVGVGLLESVALEVCGAWYPDLSGEAGWAYLSRQLTTDNPFAADLSRIDRRGQLALRLTPVHGETAHLTLDGSLRVGLGVVHTTDDLGALGTEPDELGAAATAVERHLAQVWGVSVGARMPTALVQVGVERVRYVEALEGTTLATQRPLLVSASIGVWR